MNSLHITAVSGSLRTASLTTALLTAVAALAPAGVEVAFYHGLGELPQFTPEFEDEPPPAVAEWRAVLHASNGVIICTPEYAHGMPGSLKNAIDCVVTSGGLWRKPVATLSTGPSAQGGERAHAWLLQTLAATEAQVVGSLTVPFVRSKLDAEGRISDAALVSEVEALFAHLVEAAQAQFER